MSKIISGFHFFIWNMNPFSTPAVQLFSVFSPFIWRGNDLKNILKSFFFISEGKKTFNEVILLLYRYIYILFFFCIYYIACIERLIILLRFKLVVLVVISFLFLLFCFKFSRNFRFSVWFWSFFSFKTFLYFRFQHAPAFNPYACVIFGISNKTNRSQSS